MTASASYGQLQQAGIFRRALQDDRAENQCESGKPGFEGIHIIHHTILSDLQVMICWHSARSLPVADEETPERHAHLSPVIRFRNCDVPCSWT
jgi:hypothetical protein